MKDWLIYLVKRITPPVVLDLVRPLPEHASGFSGNYGTWDEARRASGGYDSDIIRDRVRDALLKVKNGEAVYERDSVLFNEVEYSWPLLAGLLWVASQSSNRLNLIDFGGSLGSSYYQNVKFLAHLDELQWSIVEQEKFVACGKRHFENEHLKFYSDLDTCLSERQPQAILFSSVIQYIEKPYDLLKDVLMRDFTYIIFDRTSFLATEDDRITVQQVPPGIYPASYPSWFFNRDKFLSFFSEKYELMAGFAALAGTIDLGDSLAHDEGFIFRLKQPQV